MPNTCASPRGGGVLEESFDILDAEGNPTGQTKPRSLVHRDGDWHRAADIWVVNPHLGILLQRRIDNKDSWGGYWDVSCGGHLAAGDSSRAGAVRELDEELGLVVAPSELQFLLSERRSSRPAPNFLNNSFNDLYLLETDRTLAELTPQSSEISALKFVSASELEALLLAESCPLVPHPTFYAKILEILRQNPTKYAQIL